MFRTAALAAAMTVALPSVAMAHARLLSATPAADATVTAPKHVELRFSERLSPKLSGATVMMTGMGGVAHAPIAVPGVVGTVGATGDVLVLTAARPLAAGSYRVDWHVVSGDTHRVTGSYAFTVR